MLSSASIMALDHPYHHNHLQQQQQQQPPPQQQAQKQQQQQQQQQAQHIQQNQPPSGQTLANSRSSFALPILSRRCYTGVDKLLMAAMMDEAAAAAASGARSYLPSGRGIGYYGQSRDTHCQIPSPSNKSELELYRLLERANLLIYFGTFLNFGGDDVQQLSDANEEEFLEIMSLVGMTQKPLHVRRLQKALIEWRENREYETNTYHHHHQLHHQQPPPQSQHLISQHRQNQQQVAPIQMGSSAVGCSGGSSGNNNRLLFHPPSIESPTPSMRSTITSMANNDNSQDQPSYILPHELLVGAPKRIRLMDSFHERLSNPEHSPCKSDRSSLLHQADESSDQLLTCSPKSHKGHGDNDKEDDKFIEVMDSSQSE